MMRAIGDARVARMMSRCWIHCGSCRAVASRHTQTRAPEAG